MQIVLTLKEKSICIQFQNHRYIFLHTPRISPPCHNLKKMENKVKSLARKIIIIIIITTTTTTIMIIIIIIFTTTTTTIITAAAEGVVVQGYK